MGLQMGGIDHDPLGSRPFAGKAGEDAIEHSEPAPGDEAVVERLVRPIVLGRVLLLQTVADDIDDAADHARSSTRGTPCDNGK